MKSVSFLALVEESKCTGCRLCENPCPTEAIKVFQKKARVDEKACLACPNCSDVCPTNAIAMVRRVAPLAVGVDPAGVDQIALRELCVKAHLHPKQIVCLCTSTRAAEVAAAVLKGARTPEEIALVTGARSGCTLYCVEPMLRLLKAHGVALVQPKGYRWYDVTTTIWDIPKGLDEKYPQYFLEEDKELFRKP